MKEEILNSVYLNANDLKTLIPNIGIHQCRQIIKEVAEQERNKGVYIPNGKSIIAPTKAVKKRLGI